MEGGILRKIGKLNVLELDGSFRRMGRQYGGLFKEQLDEFYAAAIEGYFIKKARIPHLKLLALSRLIFRRYPEQLKEIFYGMHEGSGIGLNRLIMLDQLNVFELIRNQGIGRCSNVFAWGDYSSGGALAFGRNFDQPEYFKDFNRFVTLAVFSPECCIPTASIGYPGQIGVSAAINRYGVFIANNEAPVLKGDKIDVDAENILAAQLLFLMKSPSLKDLDRHINDAKTNCPIIVSAADAMAACTYEWTVAQIRRRPATADGFMAVTNHFTEPSWNRPVPDKDAYGMTRTRLENLSALGQRYKGKMDIEGIKELLAIGIDKGGATDEDRTILQMAVVPGRMQFHLKIPGFQEWTEVDLKTPFDRYADKAQVGERKF